MADTREMRIGERETIGFDFSSDMAANESFSSASAACANGITANGNATIGGNNNTQISQALTVDANTADGYYKLTITGTTDGGNVKKKVYLIRVVSDTTPTVANANTALVRLDEAKGYIGKSADDDTTIIDMLIDGVSHNFSAYTGRNLAYASYTNEAYDGTGYDVLYLRNYPVTGNMTVTENNTALTAGNENDYLCYNDTGRLVKVSGGGWYTGPKEVLVSYNAGYVCIGANVTLPVDVRLAALKQIAYEYKRYKAQDLGEPSTSVGEKSTSTTQEGLLKDVALALDPYRRYTL